MLKKRQCGKLTSHRSSHIDGGDALVLDSVQWFVVLMGKEEQTLCDSYCLTSQCSKPAETWFDGSLYHCSRQNVLVCYLRRMRTHGVFLGGRTGDRITASRWLHNFFYETDQVENGHGLLQQSLRRFEGLWIQRAQYKASSGTTSQKFPTW